NISLFPIDLTIAEQTAKFRGQYQIKTPDAIQLATAVSCGVDYIITNDKEWQRVTDLPIIMIDEI
ncbi:MAG: type II toxin-antitoxin system VapC family toxin, partial [Proteobacteria bacterium]|nr:type II toxin-antitoxin system VapC family toxin [Pseudomonadota bacterium]